MKTSETEIALHGGILWMLNMKALKYSIYGGLHSE